MMLTCVSGMERGLVTNFEQFATSCCRNSALATMALSPQIWSYGGLKKITRKLKGMLDMIKSCF